MSSYRSFAPINCLFWPYATASRLFWKTSLPRDKMYWIFSKWMFTKPTKCPNPTCRFHASPNGTEELYDALDIGLFLVRTEQL